MYAYFYRLDFAEVANSDVFDSAYGEILAYLQQSLLVDPEARQEHFSLDCSWSVMVASPNTRHVYL
jgi:hypothetical protein